MVKSIPKSKLKEYKNENGKVLVSWTKKLCNRASLHKTIPHVRAHTSVAFLEGVGSWELGVIPVLQLQTD